MFTVRLQGFARQRKYVYVAWRVRKCLLWSVMQHTIITIEYSIIPITFFQLIHAHVVYHFVVKVSMYNVRQSIRLFVLLDTIVILVTLQSHLCVVKHLVCVYWWDIITILYLCFQKALHVRALRTFTDAFKHKRLHGEEWLVYDSDTETYIPDVYEEVGWLYFE